MKMIDKCKKEISEKRQKYWRRGKCTKKELG